MTWLYLLLSRAAFGQELKTAETIVNTFNTYMKGKVSLAVGYAAGIAGIIAMIKNRVVWGIGLFVVAALGLGFEGVTDALKDWIGK